MKRSSIRRFAFLEGAVRSVLVPLISVLSLFPAAGQLAITEVMSSASNGLKGDDFWELTNFGTNTIDLASYWFRDDGGFSGAENLAALWAATREDEPRINPGESILFVKEVLGVITTPEDFRQWWGDANLSPDLKIVFYLGHGFNNMREDVHLWQVTAEQTNLVQLVQLFDAMPGRTFTYDRLTGVLDTFSAAGVDRAFVAAAAGDVGSPGVTTGPVPLYLVEVPANIEVDGGLPVTFSVSAWGLPPPQYQWRFNGVPIPGAHDRTFALAAASATNAGQYSVELDNGLERRVTTNATLTVNTQASCAAIVRPLADIDVTPGQTAIFHVETRGYPLPTFQWQFNGVDIPDATSSTYSVVGVDESRTGLYTVYVTNPLCATNATARLTVSPKPDLRITEAMSLPNNRVALGHDSWWELTNAGTNAVNLRGYRWDDNPPSLEGAVTVTNDVILRPGDSAIFVSSMTAEAFRCWWGEENLPANLPIISYPGNGLSMSGDSIRLWNATARDVEDKIDSLSFVNDQEGVSLWFDEAACEFGCPSVEGERGAFRAPRGSDIASPGWTSNEQRAVPRYLSLRREAAGVALRWKTEPGRTYTVEYCDDLAHPSWTNLITHPADSAWLSTTDNPVPELGQRFYRVLLEPLAP